MVCLNTCITTYLKQKRIKTHEEYKELMKGRSKLKKNKDSDTKKAVKKPVIRH